MFAEAQDEIMQMLLMIQLMLYLHRFLSVMTFVSHCFVHGHQKNNTDTFTHDAIHPVVGPHPTKPDACVVCTLVLLKATWLHSLGPKACGFLFDWQNVSPLPPSFLSPVTALLIPVTSQIPSVGIKGWSGCSALSGGEITKGMTYWFLYFILHQFMQQMRRMNMLAECEAQWI